MTVLLEHLNHIDFAMAEKLYAYYISVSFLEVKFKDEVL